MSASSCYHCGLPIPDDVDLSVKIGGETRAMCCYGCQAVAQSIVENGLEDYYRSRDALPEGHAWLRHIGIYSYRAGFLRQFPRLTPAPTEAIEALEQLRALWHGHRIAVHISAQAPGPGVDTPADLARVRALFA